MKKLLYAALVGSNMLPVNGMHYIPSLRSAPQRIASFTGTTWKFWSAAEQCKNQQWDLLIAEEYKRITNNILAIDCFTPAQEALNKALSEIRAGSKNYDAIIEQCNGLIQNLVQLRRPESDMVQKCQLLFWFKQFSSISQTSTYNQHSMSFAMHILRYSKVLLAKRLKIQNQEQGRGHEVEVDPQRGAIDFEEDEWLQKRLANVFEKQKELLRRYVSEQELEDFTRKQEPLRIGIACSGGGYRAMTFSSGALTALEELNIVGSSLYIAGLSGSTWFIAPWLVSKKVEPVHGGDELIVPLNIKEYRDRLRNKIQTANIKKNALQRTDEQVSEFIHDVVIPKALLGKPVSSVDLFGGLLARALLSSTGQKPCHKYTMQDIRERIASADVPCPLLLP